MELLPFQQEASDQIADRCIAYAAAPVRVGRRGAERHVPFLQLLNSVTASGKTLILADAVSAIAKRLPVKPVILWLSRASVVVAQSYANLADGGAYNDLLDDFQIKTLADLDETELASDARHAVLFFATVGTFNQEKREEGTLNVFKSAIDDANRSTWASLKLRPGKDGYRRPLFVVYDEAHNLSDQQVGLLLELEPDAFLLSTATSRVPQRLDAEVIGHLKKIGELSDEELQTNVDAAEVASSGLIKAGINLVGRQAPMEQVVAEMVKELSGCAKVASRAGLSFLPKAVYVCKTNIVEESGERDNHRQPFAQRKAPPILIWRQLVERLGIKPSDVVAYCDLKVDKAFPLPEEFVLFRGGDKDYDRFVYGNFKHIIFNQSLQEGWDDPSVFYAYIDKSMGSKVQAEQVVGRLLRQPGRKHYTNPKLNTAEVYVRVEAAGVFDEVVSSVETKIKTGTPGIRITATRPGKKAKKEYPPKKSYAVAVPALITDRASKRVAEFVGQMSDFRRDDGTNIRGTGKRAFVQRAIGGLMGQEFQWEEFGQSPMVLARWLFSREVARVHKGALGIAITSNPNGKLNKFDALVGLTSPAAVHIADVAKKVGEAFVDQVYLKLRTPNPFEIGPTLVTPGKEVIFRSAVHRCYDSEDLNAFEEQFARCLDAKKYPWYRNPSKSGYSIPIPTPGKTLNFFPDFLIWKGKDVYAIDTKGSFLHADAARKLVSIKPASAASGRVFVRFVSEGKVDRHGPRPDTTGFTAWTFKPSGLPDFSHCENLRLALEACLEPDI
jgi:type III restriction enzyme